MEKLIAKLKEEHVVLVDTLRKIKEIGIGTEESKQLLISAKSVLLSHIEKEDKELYPILRRAGQKNEEIRRKLAKFGRDMEDITKFVLVFFTKIENNSYTPLEYAKNFGKLVALLSARISREENILYPLYESCLE